MSATGRADGFTLVEVLVVLVILGITVSVVAVNLSRGPQAALEDEARRLAALLQHARDEAVFAGHSLAWNPEAAGYAFSKRERGRGWVGVEDEAALRPRAWSPGVDLAQLRIGGIAVDVRTPLYFAASGVNLPFDLVLASGNRRWFVSSDAAGRISMQPDPLQE